MQLICTPLVYPRTVNHAPVGLMVSRDTNLAELPIVSPKSSYSMFLDLQTRFYNYSYHVLGNFISAPVLPMKCLHNH